MLQVPEGGRLLLEGLCKHRLREHRAGDGVNRGLRLPKLPRDDLELPHSGERDVELGELQDGTLVCE